MNLNYKNKEAYHFTDLATAQKKAQEINGILIIGKGKSLGQFIVKNKEGA